MQETGYKRCPGCEIEKPLTDYFRDKGRKDGHQSRCKACQQAARRGWNENNRERYTENRKRWVEKHPERQAELEVQSRERHPEKYSARMTLRNAVAKGHVAKPTCCESCKATRPTGEIQGHHHDYSKPLDVEWLCATCHSQLHIKDPAQA